MRSTQRLPRHGAASGNAWGFRPTVLATRSRRTLGRNWTLGSLLGSTWQRHRLTVLASLAVAALVFGFVGSLRLGQPVPDAIYDTICLLTFNYIPPEGESPGWMIQVARIMAPAVTAYATFAAITAVLDEQWQRQRAARQRRHLVVCGLGGPGLQVVRSARTGPRRTRVVAVEIDPASPGFVAARRLGARIVQGDATDPDVLRLAATQRARALFAVCGDDVTNAAVASAARSVVATRGGPLTVYCHASEPSLAGELSGLGFVGSTDRFMAEWFSLPERAAKAMLAEHGNVDATPPPHIVIVGTDAYAQALILNAARQRRALGAATPMRLTVLGRDAGATVERLERRHPALASAAEIHTDEDEPGTHSPPADAMAVYVCAPSDTLGVEIGLRIARLSSRPLPIVVRIFSNGRGLADALSQRAREAATIELFSVTERTCTVSMITDGVVETLARALHGIYLEESERSSEPDPERPLCPYDHLDEELKAANRAHARGIASKLQDLGCELRPLTDWEPNVLQLSEHEVERLAESEHARWNADRLAHGWRWGPKTIRAEKINKWIDVPWSDLPDSMKEYDRAFVRGIGRTLAAAGYEVRRVPATGDAAPGRTRRPKAVV